MSHYCCRQCNQRYDYCRCVGNPPIAKVTNELEKKIEDYVKKIYPTPEEIASSIAKFMLEQGYKIK